MQTADGFNFSSKLGLGNCRADPLYVNIHEDVRHEKTGLSRSHKTGKSLFLIPSFILQRCSPYENQNQLKDALVFTTEIENDMKCSCFDYQGIDVQ
jgi:hypothetical protein